MKKTFFLWLFLIILSGAVLFWVGAIVASKCWGVNFTSDSIVLTFVGIIATFVVIGNYAHTKAIEEKFEEKIKELEVKNAEIEDNIEFLKLTYRTLSATFSKISASNKIENSSEKPVSKRKKTRKDD